LSNYLNNQKSVAFCPPKTNEAQKKSPQLFTFQVNKKKGAECC
jgi:hypothetical protein